MNPGTPFDSAYEALSAPWIIGEPQPAVVDLERNGWIKGAVLDVGCGMGEHTIHLAKLGYDVLGIDFSPPAVEQARRNAVRQRVPARFHVVDALHLGDRPRFDTVIDSALFHVFDPSERDAYTASLHAVCPRGRPPPQPPHRPASGHDRLAGPSATQLAATHPRNRQPRRERPLLPRSGCRGDHLVGV
jgi:SAM-dependent methyltransferase